MKKSIIIFILLLFSFCAKAQFTTTSTTTAPLVSAAAIPAPIPVSPLEMHTAFGQQMATMFSALEKNRVPHGLLLDLAMEFTNVPAYNGTLSDSTYVQPKSLKEIYNTLLMSRIQDVTTGFVTPNQFENNWFAQRAETHIALSGLYFKYSRFASNASTSGKLTYTNGKIYDKYVNNIWQNPYQEMQTFAMTSPVDVYKGLNLKVKIPQVVFYSNYANEVQSITIDFQDGLGFRQVPFDQLINVNYLTEGVRTWTYKLTLTNGQTIFSHSKIKIKKEIRITKINTSTSTAYRTANNITWNNCNSTNTDLYSIDIQSSSNYAGSPGRARVFIDDAGNDCKITKPLIVVEGFDLTTIISPETRFTSDDYLNFLLSVREGGNLSTLINGNPIINGDQQYDIIYVNWDNGMDFIQRNALVVEEVIKWVNTQKAIAGSIEKNVLLGQSMGGIVCRNALLNMEQKVPADIHQVRLFVSQDSPQQGATLPLSIQYLFNNIKNQVIQAPAYWIFNGVSQLSQTIAQSGIPINSINNPLPIFGSLLDRPATAQMLVNRINSWYGLDNTTHINFYNSLNSRGFPNQQGIRNIAISNGSECGQTQNFNQGDVLISYTGTKKLSFIQNILAPFAAAFGGILVDTDLLSVTALSLFPGGSRFDAFLEDRALYQYGGNKIHDLNISYTKWVLGIWKQKVYIINKQLNQPPTINKHFDNYGGGFIDIGSYSGALNVSGLFVRDKFCLVPTPSSLSINATTDANFKIPYIGALPPLAPLNTPFTNFTTAFKSANNFNRNNEKHLEFNARNGNWLAAELNNAAENNDCSFLCDSATISGPQVICNGTNNNFSAPSGGSSFEWIVTSGQNLVTIINPDSQTAIISALTSVSGSVTIRVNIFGISTTLNNNRQSCGFLTKTIWVGLPSTNYTKTAFKYPCYNEFKALEQPETFYEWEFISGTGAASTFEDLNFYTNGSTVMFEAYSSYTIQLKLTTTNSCGTSVQIINRNYNYPVGPPFCQPRRPANPLTNNSFYKTYPNPSNNLVNIELKNQDEKPQPNAVIYAELYNMMGEIKRNVSITNNIATFDVIGLPQGIYILKINIDGIIESHQVAIE